MTYRTASWIASQCEVTPAAVSNWVSRDVLPRDLMPDTFARTANGKTWLWTIDQAQGIRLWHEDRKAKRERKSDA